MDIERALKLTKSTELKAACLEVEQRNVDIVIINKLYQLYYAAIKRELSCQAL